MATVTRTTRYTERTKSYENNVDSHVPEPFPIDTVRQYRLEQSVLQSTPADGSPFLIDVREGKKTLQEGPSNIEPINTTFTDEQVQSEILPSIIQVQISCLTALNNLLFAHDILKSNWQPIVPTRRHSMPTPSAIKDTLQSNAVSFSESLYTLLNNLRNVTQDEMLQINSNSDDGALIAELRRRILDLGVEFTPHDFNLACSLTSLLSHVHRVSMVDKELLGSSSLYSGLSTTDNTHDALDIYSDLRKQFQNLQIQRTDSSTSAPRSDLAPRQTVEIALLWDKIDQELETVFLLCRERSQIEPFDQLPPEYEFMEGDAQLPPEYDQDKYDDYLKSSPKSQHIRLSNDHLAVSNEKMRLDLEAVTMAIDRLYLVAPQLHSQRVELKKHKIEELERARLAGVSKQSINSVREGKQKANDDTELDGILDLIGKVSSRKLVDQSFVLEGGMTSRLRKTQERDKERRDAFVDKLLHHSNSGRLHSQDAVLHKNKIRDPEALLTFPEFIREKMPDHLQKPDPKTLLSLPEFVNEPPPLNIPITSPERAYKRHSRPGARNRSVSAPPLAWLLPSLSRSPSPMPRTNTDEFREVESSKAGLTVRYVAEHHESLQHVVVCLGVEGIIPGVDLEAEVVPFLGGAQEGKELILSCANLRSASLSLPVPVPAGKKEVRVQGGHFEIKMSARSTGTSMSSASNQDLPALMDASQLSKLNPTSFICSSCSLPLFQPCGKSRYDDLPSEHWSELLEAWVCHRDQKLHEEVSKHSDGFWPRPDQVLVGGSYLIVEESSVVQYNLHRDESTKDGWRRVSCICGAVVGRCRDRKSQDGPSVVYYRFAKYGFRPVSLTAPPSRYPFSSFILADMMEFVTAHATHRFVICDEENERPRILIWLFKSHMRLSYATTAQYTLPQSGTIHAAKVLFKLLGPETTSQNLQSILNKHPGFPQAEHLSYPMSICQRLAALLRESNTAYPIGMRVMTGLFVGWLQRA